LEAQVPDGVELILVDSFEEVEAFMRWLGERRPILGFDLETSGLDPYRERIRLAQFGDGATGWAVPYQDWRGLIKEVMTRYDQPMVAHNAKFDCSFLEHDEIQVPRHLLHDSMTMLHLFDSQGPKALKQGAKRHVGGWSVRGEQELKMGMKKAKWTWATVPVDFEPFWSYGALDTVLTARLAEALWPKIQPYREAYELELAVTWVLLDLEQRGIRVDLDYIHRAITPLQEQLLDIEDRWPGINLHSSTQVVKALEADGVRLIKRTQKGNTSLDDEVLQTVDHPLAVDTLEARSKKKIITTYFEPFLRWSVDDILHPNINPLGAEKTGRMSITRPGMQTLPRKKIVRDAIIPRDGNSLIAADYQGQEMRVMAHYCGDKRMLEAYHAGQDLHTYTASQIYGVEEPSKEQRRIAKQSGFAKIYGAGYKKFALTAGIPVGEAKSFLTRYDQMFPGVSQFMRKAVNAVHERDEGGFGYVMTIGGRKVRVPVSKAYVAVNYTIQGSCSDITKRAMVDADRAGLSDYMILPVHDEILWDVPSHNVDGIVPEIKAVMERTDLRVPLPVDINIGDRWGAFYDE
jgi:DNA polymerase-1